MLLVSWEAVIPHSQLLQAGQPAQPIRHALQKVRAQPPVYRPWDSIAERVSMRQQPQVAVTPMRYICMGTKCVSLYDQSLKEHHKKSACRQTSCKHLTAAPAWGMCCRVQGIKLTETPSQAAPLSPLAADAGHCWITTCRTPWKQGRVFCLECATCQPYSGVLRYRLALHCCCPCMTLWCHSGHAGAFADKCAGSNCTKSTLAICDPAADCTQYNGDC